MASKDSIEIRTTANKQAKEGYAHLRQQWFELEDGHGHKMEVCQSLTSGHLSFEVGNERYLVDVRKIAEHIFSEHLKQMSESKEE